MALFLKKIKNIVYLTKYYIIIYKLYLLVIVDEYSVACGFFSVDELTFYNIASEIRGNGFCRKPNFVWQS